MITKNKVMFGYLVIFQSGFKTITNRLINVVFYYLKCGVAETQTYLKRYPER